jgi:hypothetical protein
VLTEVVEVIVALGFEIVDATALRLLATDKMQGGVRGGARGPLGAGKWEEGGVRCSSARFKGGRWWGKKGGGSRRWARRKERGRGHTMGLGRGSSTGTMHPRGRRAAVGVTLSLEPKTGEVHREADGWAPSYSPGWRQFDLIQIQIVPKFDRPIGDLPKLKFF